MNRINISSGAKWEDIVGYSRLVKINNLIFISGTTGLDETGKVVGKNDPYKQTIQALENIKTALSKVNCTLENVVRTRMFVTDIENWQEYGKAHGEFFKNIKPATSMVEVSKLIDSEMLIEIEADAVLD